MDQRWLDSRVLLSGMIALKGSLKLSTHLYWVRGVEGYSVHVRAKTKFSTHRLQRGWKRSSKTMVGQNFSLLYR